MSKLILFTFFNVVAIWQSLSSDIQTISDVQFVCGNSQTLLKCWCNQETDKIKHVPLFSIDCSRLEMKNVPKSNILPTLTGRLDLSHNLIVNLNHEIELRSDWLYYLDLSYNRINAIEDGIFGNLTTLFELNLRNNDIENVNQGSFRGLEKLKVLNLEANKLKQFPANVFNFLVELETLKLSNNFLGPFLTNNALSTFVPSGLKILHIDAVGLKSINNFTFANLLNFVELSTAYNPLDELPDLMLSNLEYLDISGTNISNLSQENLKFPRLKTLKLNRLLYLTNIYNYTFARLDLLEELYIEHCIRLREINMLAFGFLLDKNTAKRFRLKKFSVAFSGLKTLSDSFLFVFEDLEEVNLQGNFWQCDCSLSWFHYLKQNVKNVNRLKCASPVSHMNKTIHELSYHNFCDKPQQAQKRQRQNSYISIQKWLFPLVAVLSVVVLFLVGVLVYLGPYETHVRSKTKTLGPDSPYNRITIRPNQAEYLMNT